MIARVYDVLDCSTDPAKFYKVGVGVPENCNEARCLKWVPLGESGKFTAEVIASMPKEHLSKMIGFLESHVKTLEANSCVLTERKIKALKKG